MHHSFYIRSFALILISLSKVSGIEAKRIEEYCKKMPHVDVKTKKIMITGIASYGGMKINVDGNSIVLQHISQVASCIEIKSNDDLILLISYFRSRDFKLKYLSVNAVVNLIKNNQIPNIPEYDYSIFLEENEDDYKTLIDEILKIISKIHTFDKS
jgi:hypothetical protein